MNIDRDKGGLSVFNIFVKSECLFACRMLKQFLGNEDQTSLIAYYNAIRLNPLVKINTLPRNVSFTSTPFYDKGISTIRKCLKMNSFPNISSKMTYVHIMNQPVPKFQEKYPLYG